MLWYDYHSIAHFCACQVFCECLKIKTCIMHYQYNECEFSTCVSFERGQLVMIMLRVNQLKINLY